MKKIILLTSVVLLSSCATLFTSSRQTISIVGEPGIQVYDTRTNIKLAEIPQEKSTSFSIKKGLADKQLLAKKKGFTPKPFLLETTFNKTSLWNILFWPGFLIDLGTGQINKYDNTIINLELEADNE